MTKEFASGGTIHSGEFKWDGSGRGCEYIIPWSMLKHRDYEHATFFEHAMAQGGYYIVDDVVYVDSDPVTGEIFDPPRIYYEVTINSQEFSKPYTYLIPAESDNTAPLRSTVEKTVESYIKNPVQGGRNRENYIDLPTMEEERERLNRLRRKLKYRRNK